MPAGVRLLTSLTVVLAVTACSGGRDAEVSAAAEDFFTAVADGDGDAACQLLTPATRSELETSTGAPCAEAVLDEVNTADASPAVAVYGDAARVRVGNQTAFLVLVEGGWRVTAAGCTAPPTENVPYDCTVSGG